jgi:diguanylate cyclase (GGDEF)-like protein
MVDRRLVLSIAAAIVALATGVLAVVISQPALGVVAGAAGVVAGAAGAALAAQLQHTEARLASTTDDVQRLHRELDAVAAILEEEANRRDGDAEELAAANNGDHAFDQTTGLYDERYFAVLVQQQVAAARRSLRPISVVIFEIDGLHGSDGHTRDQALGVVGDVVRRTLRESDSACRLGELMIGAILEDTSETGAVWAAERVRGTLLGSPVGDSLTVSAGVACYPTHALGAAELVAQAGKALDEARRRGADRVETAPEA